MTKQIKAFSLVEVVATMAIVGILAAVAVPVFTDKIKQARRADGINTLAAIAVAQERYRTHNPAYGGINEVWSGVTTTPDGHYNVDLINCTETSYTITATAAGGQSGDKQDGVACSDLKLEVTNGIVSKTPAKCWAK